MTDNITAAHAAAEHFAARLATAGVSAADIAEALTTTGLAFLAAEHPEAAAVMTANFFEVLNAHE
jgi:hypothetical protein